MKNIGIEEARRVFGANHLPEPRTLRGIEVGFTNEVYSIDDIYILKVCTDPRNEQAFRIEDAMYRRFRDMLPVPNVLAFDASREILKYPYFIYPRIPGDNLYNQWHLYSNTTRRSIVKELCGMLRCIASTDLQDLPDIISPVHSWKETVLQRIQTHVDICGRAGYLSHAEVEVIERFCTNNAACLSEQHMALVYWDAHFDNVLVRDGEIVGLLDFERTSIASMDFMLDVVKRMVEFPKKYMSAYVEQFARSEDYAELLAWYKEFFPEAFAFSSLPCRLDLYALAHDLEDLESWPNVPELKANILRVAASHLDEGGRLPGL